MTRIHPRAWWFAVLSAALQALVFPHPNLFWLSWVCLTPLLLAITHGRHGHPLFMWQAFRVGYLCGVLWYAGACYWVWHVMHIYGGLSGPIAAVILLLFCLYLGLYHALFAVLLSWVAQRSRFALLAIPFLWVSVELARSRITSFPWNLLGTSQVGNIPLTSIAPFTGVYGVSFVIVVINTVFAAAMWKHRPERWNLVALGTMAAVTLQLGMLVRPKADPAPYTATLVQQNVPVLNRRWTADQFDRTLAELVALSRRPADPAQSGAPHWIIWPESPAPFYKNDPKLRTWLSTLAQDSQSSLIIGGFGLPRRDGGLSGGEHVYNSAFFIRPDGAWAARYDKIHLVPFGEYLPMQDALFFAQVLTAEVGDFLRGGERLVFAGGEVNPGVFICYESVFPDEIRRFAKNGATVLVNISNDGWFGDTAAPLQHLNMARMRAVENRRWLLRATNTGITTSVDPHGRMTAVAPPDTRTRLDVHFNSLTGLTFYTRHGDWFAYACAIISVVFLLFKAKTQPQIHAAKR